VTNSTERVRRFVPRVPRCRACGMPSAEGRRMIAGPGVYLCGSCITLLSTQEPAAAPAAQCSFCRRRDVPIAGALPSVALCAACLELSQSILAEDDRRSRAAT
jgi:ClpX C4-type zinc finger